MNFRFTLTEQWEAGNYHIIFWSMTSKAEFSKESPVQGLYICSIYVAKTHLADIFYKNFSTLLLQFWLTSWLIVQKLLFQKNQRQKNFVNT